MLELQDFQISHHEKARNLVRNLFQPLPLLQKGLYCRGQIFGIDGFLRAASAASYAHLNDDPVWWWWNFTCDQLGWASRLVPSDYDKAPEIDFVPDFELYSWEKSGSPATVLPDARRRLLTARRPRVTECPVRWRYIDRQKYGLLAASYNSPRGLDSRWKLVHIGEM